MAAALARRFSGPEKAAIFLLALGEEHGQAVWEQLKDEEIRTVSAAMSSLGTVEADTVENLVIEFAEQLGSRFVTGTADRTRALLLRFLPSGRVDQIMEEIDGATDRSMWQRLSATHEAVLANYVKNELPQTAALILSKMAAQQASRVLSILPQDFAVQVVDRMLSVGNVPRAIVERVEETLRSDFLTSNVKGTPNDPIQRVVEVISFLDRQSELRVMGGLDGINAEAAERIRALMFTFEDVARLDSAALQLVISKTDRDVLARALKGAPDHIRRTFMAHMSERAATILADQLAALRPLRLREVDDAQMAIVAIAKQMEKEGRLTIAKNTPEDELVY